jgi:hypothetical protein
MASADGALGGEVPKYQFEIERAHSMQIERDVFRLLGKVHYATKSLKGRLAVAQPPGATWRLREIKLARATNEVKAQARFSGGFVSDLRGEDGVPWRGEAQSSISFLNQW